MDKVTVNLGAPTPYAEPSSWLYRTKRRLTLLTVLKWIKATTTSCSFSLLEVGTGSGYLLAFLEADFPNAKLRGVEYDSRLVELAQSRLSTTIVTQANAESFSFPGETFDIIVSLQVVEHLYEPCKMFDAVHRHLRPNGIFIFTTPNLTGLGARLMGKRWHALTPDHVSLGSFDDWKRDAQLSGFSTIYCGSTFFSGIPWMNRFPLGLINWGLLMTFGTLPWKFGESFFGVFRRSALSSASGAFRSVQR